MQTTNELAREEKLLSPKNGLPILMLLLASCAAAIALMVVSIYGLTAGFSGLMLTILLATSFYLVIFFPILLSGLKIINPNEAAVYVLFGRYYGTITKAGFFWINPFCAAINPAVENVSPAAAAASVSAAALTTGYTQVHAVQYARNKKISLKAMTLNNERQKINDREGNPIDIGVVVIWRVVNATKAVFEVDNYIHYVSTQCDAAIRQVARQYPYDISQDGDEESLRGSASAVAEELRCELQSRVNIAGVEIIEARIAHLAYAQEIAAAMLQRQQADAIIAARQKIVDGAVGMVEMALTKLSENNIVNLDDERRAAMVSNLLVVLCGNRDAQPIVNSGSIY